MYLYKPDTVSVTILGTPSYLDVTFLYTHFMHSRTLKALQRQQYFKAVD